MHCSRNTTVIFLSLFLGLATASFATTTHFVAKKAGDTWTCQLKDQSPEGAGFIFQVLPQGASATAQFALKAKAKGSGGDVKTFSLQTIDSQKTQGVVISPTDLAAGAKPEDVEIAGTIDGQPVNCSPPSSQPQPKDSTCGPGIPADTCALTWFESPEGKEALRSYQQESEKKNGLFPKGTVFVVHLPSGAAVTPPESISEDQYLQVLVIQPVTSLPYTIKISSCLARSNFRVLGSAEDFKSLFPKAQGASRAQLLLPVGGPFRCGPDEVAYHPQPPDDATAVSDTHVRIRPIYQVATTFVYGFDFARQDTFSVESGKIAKTEDKIGPGLRIGFTWFPGGLDPENLTAYNHWFNPFAVFDPAAPTENFIVGTTFTKRGGVSLAIGASVHKITVLRAGVPGDPFTGQGDVPTRKEWNRRGVGLFVGVAMDSNAFKILQEFVKK
jgi:hypothetical protein